MNQREPAGARRTQTKPEKAGGAKGSREEVGGTTRSHEEPGEAMRSQEKPGGGQEKPGGASEGQRIRTLDDRQREKRMDAMVSSRSPGSRARRLSGS